MNKLKLTLNSRAPRFVHDINGKRYKLFPGENILQLSDEDYSSLIKALKVNTPVKPTLSEKPMSDEKSILNEKTKPDEKLNVEDYTVESKKEDKPEKVEASSTDSVEPSSVEKKDSVDYESMTVSQLKVVYKDLTGETCKIKKKADIIAFLREHS